MNALRMPRLPRGRAPIAFTVIVMLMYAVDGTLVRSPLFSERPDLLAAAASFDLTIGVTAAYWLLVVRRKLAAPRTLITVFVLSVVAATATLPPGHRDLVYDIRYLGIPFELAVIALVFIAARRTKRSLAAAGIELDTPERIRFVLGGTGMNRRLADVMATEMSMLYFAIASWRRAPFVPSKATGFSYHRKTGYASLLYALVPIALVESLAVDLVVRIHHPLAANILLAVSVFTAIWLLGLARGVQLRPILVTPSDVHVRNGLQWVVEIPRAAIERVDYGEVAAPPKRTPGYLRAVPGRSNALIILRTPIAARGPYGMTRTVSQVGLVVDDLDGFRRAMTTP